MFSLSPAALMLSALRRLSQGLGFEVFVVVTFCGQMLRTRCSRQLVAKKMPVLPELQAKQSSGHGSGVLATERQWVGVTFWQPACLSD